MRKSPVIGGPVAASPVCPATAMAPPVPPSLCDGAGPLSTGCRLSARIHAVREGEGRGGRNRLGSFPPKTLAAELDDLEGRALRIADHGEGSLRGVLGAHQPLPAQVLDLLDGRGHVGG